MNGVPSCASKQLLTENLREKWGFNGYVTSDCGAISCVQNDHHFTNSTDDTCATALSAGTDNDCGPFFGYGNGNGTNLARAIDSGAVPRALWQPALANLLRVQMRLGMFDPDAAQPFRRLGADMVDTPAHRLLALEAARQGVVLVKNEGGALPLATGSASTVAVVGPNANATAGLLSNYHGNAPFVISPLQGLARYARNVTYAQGCSIAGTGSAGIAAAAATARAADATVIVVGLDQSQESEGKDRTSIALPGEQAQLIERVAAAAGGKVALVVIGGGAVDLAAAKANPKVSAILIAGYPGQSGGQAIAETLFGDNNPGGKLTQTWYRQEFTEQCSMLDMNMRPNRTTGCPGRGYRFFTGSPVFAFGEGLSYTTFRHQAAAVRASAPAASLSAAALGADIEATRHRPHLAPVVHTVRIVITNVGVRAGAETALGFVSPPGAGDGGEPLRSLRRYEKVFLAPGASATVELGFTAHDLATTDAAGYARPIPGLWKLSVGRVTSTVFVTD